MDALEMGLKYSMFVTEEYMRQAEYQRYLEECVLIGINEATREKIDIINEGFADSLKNGIKKLWNAIVKMWHKFLEGMNTLFRTDKSYLEKYKDTILKKKFPEGTTVTMHNYPEGIKRLVAAKVPAFNVAVIQRFEDGSKDQEAIEHEMKANMFKVYYNGKYDTTDNVKTFLRGDTTTEKEFDGNKLNMTDIYNYCHDAENLNKSIEKDIKELESDVNKILSLVDSKSAALPKQESFYFVVYNTYVTEGDIKTPDAGKGDNNTAASGGADSKPSTQVSQANKNTTDQSNTDSFNDKVNNTKSEDEFKALSTACRAYLKVCGEFLGVKLTISKEIYSMYMQIIKALVRNTVGDNQAKDKPVKDTATEYDGSKNNEEVKMAKV